MAAFCTTARYHAKYVYCDLPDDYLAEWLADASDVIGGVIADAGVDISTTELGGASSATCERVCRDMVHRAIGDGSSYMNGQSGTTQFFATGDQYSQTVNMGNGFADLFIRKQERRDILTALRADGLTGYGAVHAACAAPSFGVFDGE